MKKYDEAIKEALEKLKNREKYAYFYGAKGEVLTDSVMRRLWASEPGYFSRYTAEEQRQIFENSRGKIGYDCSGFTGSCTGDMTYSAAQASHGKANASLAEGPAGSLLYTTYNGKGRHIGLDIGYGFYIHMMKESTNKNIQEGTAGVVLGRIRDNTIPWERSVMSSFLDYTGASSK